MRDTLHIPGWRHVASGKVRDLYRNENPDDTRLLLVASDRVSAFDEVLEPGIPGKGALLTRLSKWWFAVLDAGPNPIANHLLPEDLRAADLPPEVADRAMIARSLEMLPVECVVRGYLTGSGWQEYVAAGTVCGIVLPAGLTEGDRLPQPLFTPAWKAPAGEHDENISYQRMEEIVGPEDAAALRDLSLEIYRRAAELAHQHGLILADTKFEFGKDEGGVIRLADEVLTSDSSRYWDAETWAASSVPAERMASFDKQIIRNWLSANWDKTGAPPQLPAEIVDQTHRRYAELLDKLAVG